MEESTVKIETEEGQLITVKGIPGEKGKDSDPKEVAEVIKSDNEFIEMVKGENGYTPIKNVDYFDGEDGKTPSKKELVNLMLPLIPEPIPGKDGSPDSPKDIATKLNTLKEVINYSVIKGAPDIKSIKKELDKGLNDVKGKLDMRWHGAGLSKVFTDNTLTGTGTAASPLSVTSISTGSIISATDSGNHKNFTLSKALTTTSYYVIMNNGSYTTDDSSFPFSASGSTLVFNSALPADLAATIIKVICV